MLANDDAPALVSDERESNVRRLFGMMNRKERLHAWATVRKRKVKRANARKSGARMKRHRRR